MLKHPLYELALRRLAGSDRFRLDGRFSEIKPKVGLTAMFIQAMALPAFLSQNWLNISGEMDRLGISSLGDYGFYRPSSKQYAENANPFEASKMRSFQLVSPGKHNNLEVHSCIPY
jgi:hypothetical protein